MFSSFFCPEVENHSFQFMRNLLSIVESVGIASDASSETLKIDNILGLRDITRDVRGGAFSSGAGRGQKSAGRGKRTRKSTDPKIRQKCVYCHGDICSVL